MRLIFAPLLWLGRVLLWFVLLPVGLWRSIHHGRRKSERRIIAELTKSAPPQVTAAPMRIRGIPSDTLPPAP